MTSDTPEGSSPGFRPLYRQVKQILVNRLRDGTWRPGVLIPSEVQIAADLGVSQGTVRKALDEMRGENLLISQQGRGTFVARHDEARILFQFFKIIPKIGPPVFPESELRGVSTGTANAQEQRALRLKAGDPVTRIARLRSLAGRLTISEYLSVPAGIFPGLGADIRVENNLYDLYASRYGITVSRSEERITAVGLPSEDATLLGLATGTPVLAIDRIAIALDGQPVEWRRSLCSTADCAYVSELR
jgi:GntR family transcriptional regulator